MQAGTITEIAIPAGDSVSRPGWDGWVVSRDGDAWVRPGRSCWELGVEKNPANKANKDYDKRTKETSEQLRRETAYVALTARHWKNKATWAAEKRGGKQWKDVVAFDADDLEAWLEYYPPVALAFAGHIGLAGDGVETVSRHWAVWASQSRPPITMQAFFADRTEAKEHLIAELRRRIESSDSSVYALRADSAAEAAAFVCAALLEDASEIADVALVVTTEAGWRFVESNPQLRLAIATHPEIAQRPASGAVTIVPTAAGDLTSGYGKMHGEGFQLELNRPSIYKFRDALIEIGVEETDARRLALATGRSWTVFRRRCASNPAIRRPAWLERPESDALAMVCLLGSWHGGKEADRAIVEKLSGDSYEVIERKLRALSQVDDAPILLLGKVWRAKAPLELLELFADRITSDQLDRFFEIVESLLTQTDPGLELDVDQRWMAQVYGKVRDESGLLFESVCDSLVKLAVRGSDFPGLGSQNVDNRVQHLVQTLLGDANENRWLSLASHLRPLAEAAPQAFLRAVEASLTQPNPPVARLFSEGVAGEQPLTGAGWYYADLLWALETLAWSPHWMPRVATILARLSHLPLPENWGNRPANSLLDIFRSWCPHTNANLEQRLAVLDTLIKQEPESAFALMDRLLPRGPDFTTGSSTPVWRDDDAGSSVRPTWEDINRQNGAVADRMLAMTEGHAPRLVLVLDKLDLFDADRAKKIESIVSGFTQPSAADLDRELIRSALRKQLHWHLSYGARHPDTAWEAEAVARWNALFEALAPADLVLRHRWLFESSWVDLPLADEEDHSQNDHRREQWRLEALAEIYRDLGIAGVARLAETSADAGLVGRCLLDIIPDRSVLTDWILSQNTDFSVGTPTASMVSGILRGLSGDETPAILDRVLTSGREQCWSAERIAAFLRLARDETLTWDVVETCGGEVETQYWRIVVPWVWGDDVGMRERVVERLMEANRPIMALEIATHGPDGIAPVLLLDILEAALSSTEKAIKFPDSWRLGKLFEYLDASEEVDELRLLRVQFHLVPVFRVDRTSSLTRLMEAITSQPELLTELVCLLYRPEHGESDNAALFTEADRIAASNAWQLLHDCKRQPGTRSDGTIDPEACARFVDQTLALCQAQDRFEMGQQTIGQILAHAPKGEDGVWPGLPARDILNRPELEEMRTGFEIGTRNKRGVSVRSPTAGGDQERALASKFRSWSGELTASHPHLSESLEQIARSYDADARREDDQAALTRERY